MLVWIRSCRRGIFFPYGLYPEDLFPQISSEPWSRPPTLPSYIVSFYRQVVGSIDRTGPSQHGGRGNENPEVHLGGQHWVTSSDSWTIPEEVESNTRPVRSEHHVQQRGHCSVFRLKPQH